ncbi:putative Cu-dependent DNA-binding protein [Aspergillus fijiensis CBS 313.89]|uniref:Copper-fist-domain-containing protein n=1 Tax=Aspergillus fijiensis CBS 313.89 TaxID=1448319 RepID=A0A8G1RRI2_9EURO|nr:copper-fist-domain-containing protein [Aspergillus fijiensis CBS 313.89]RAK75396.1 copper-fist-domain-containing protein [Aspergillus fijiensis CBS 313.89]
MLIDGEKWACEACVRGHRVTTCKHHDRPLIHINRKGRPFATCSVCNCTPCEAPEDHAKLKREADARCQASKRAAGRSPRSTSVGSLKPIAPRPAPSSTGGGSSGGAGAGFRRDSHSPPTGDYDDHRPRSIISVSPPPPPPPPSSQLCHQQQQQQGLIPGTPGSSPIYLPGTSTSTAYPSPSYCTISDIPSSLSMVNPLDFENGVGVGVSSYADSASAAAIYALEDLDVNALPADVFQGDWSWLSLSEEAALRDEV